MRRRRILPVLLFTAWCLLAVLVVVEAEEHVATAFVDAESIETIETIAVLKEEENENDIQSIRNDDAIRNDGEARPAAATTVIEAVNDIASEAQVLTEAVQESKESIIPESAEPIPEAENVVPIGESLPVPPSAPTLTTATTTTGDSKRLWGSNHVSTKDASNNISGDAGLAPSADSNNNNNNTSTGKEHRPFVPSSTKSPHHAVPPQGFVLTARVYTDPSDKLSHFDFDPAALTLPYWDCGVAGSTTQQISLKHGYFRHALAATTATMTATEESSLSSSSSSSSPSSQMHPVLVVALQPVQIVLNSGQRHHFAAGDVILLEDVIRPGHKIQSVQQDGGPHGHHYAHIDVQLLCLTLPYPYHHTGKNHVSMPALATAAAQVQNPCPIPGSTSGARGDDQYAGVSGNGTPSSSSSSASSSSATSAPFVLTSPVHRQSPIAAVWKHPDVARWLLLGVAGLSASTLVVDFVAKTAPLWLAVGVGGGCLVTATTYGFCRVGDYLWTLTEIWYEKRRLGAPPEDDDDDTTATTDDNDSGDDDEDDDTAPL